MQFIKQSTAVTVIMGPFVDSIDGSTAKTALAISQADVRLSKNGGDPAQKNEASNAIHKENGYYAVYLDSTDTNTLGRLRAIISKATALNVKEDFMVISAGAYTNLVEGGP
jgi:hypothetical protein